MDDFSHDPHSSRSPRLVIVSNRVPAKSESPGGLAVAMLDATANRECLWFGWSGDPDPSTPGQVRDIEDGLTTYSLLDIDHKDFVRYYEGYANRTLWPAFHYRLDLSAFDKADFEAYQRVNTLMADQLAMRLRPDDVIWVHDYQLLTLPSELRRLGVRNRIGFFLHIPFPSPELFQAIPGRTEIIQGLLAAELVGFQSDQDRSNFERYVCEHEGGYWLPDGSVSAHGQVARSRTFPIGIDVDAFQRMAETSAGSPSLKRLALQSADRSLIIGIDRMDYSKGLPERLDAVDQLFAQAPDLCGECTLMQIAPVSRGNVQAYVDLRKRLEGQVGHVNGLYGTLDWTPVQFITRAVPRFDIAGLMRLAHVGLVTPLRDGMNLVAKEFVAAQDPADPGVLILSEFAGAAEQMSEALVVNPHNAHEQADAIERALSMPLAERRRRHDALKNVINRWDARWWSTSFLEDLTANTLNTRQELGAAIGNLFADAPSSASSSVS